MITLFNTQRESLHNTAHRHNMACTLQHQQSKLLFSALLYRVCCYVSLSHWTPKARCRTDQDRPRILAPPRWFQWPLDPHRVRVICTHTLSVSRIMQFRNFTGQWMRPAQRKKELAHFPHCDYVSPSRGANGFYTTTPSCVLIWRRWLAGQSWNAHIVFYSPRLMCDGLISKPRRFRKNASSSSNPLTRRGLTVSCHCFLFPDFSVALRQHRWCQHTRLRSKVKRD